MSDNKHFYLASVKEVRIQGNYHMQDFLRIIIQYLQNEGFADTATVLQEESNVKLNVQKVNQTHLKRMKNAILGCLL